MPVMLPPHDRLDLIAKVGEEAQGIGLLVDDARNPPRDQNLARHHASVRFIHHALPSRYRALEFRKCGEAERA